MRGKGRGRRHGEVRGQLLRRGSGRRGNKKGGGASSRQLLDLWHQLDEREGDDQRPGGLWRLGLLLLWWGRFWSSCRVSFGHRLCNLGSGGEERAGGSHTAPLLLLSPGA